MNYSELLKEVTPNGTQTLSKMRNRFPSIYPQILSYGKGGHVLEAFEGRRYIDLIAGLGCISVGYGNDEVNNSIKCQLSCGITFSLPNLLEYHVAKKLTELVPGTDMWKFGKTGTDGVLMAVRAARAYTGRSKILTSGYHGCSDHFECLGTRKAGMIDMSRYTNQLYQLDYADESYAAIILEPWVLDQTITKEVRDWCNETGTLLIADEVVTGGRFNGFTASSYIKVEPDLYVLGKGLANGLPLCAVGGTRRIMQTFERDDFFASGTFGSESLSLAACLATVNILQAKIPQMIWNGSRIKEAFNKLDWEAKAAGYPTRLDFQFKNDTEKYTFWQEMCRNGVLLGHNNFIMADHTDEDVTSIIEAMFKSYKAIKDGAQLEGPIPEATNLRKN